MPDSTEWHIRVEPVEGGGSRIVQSFVVLKLNPIMDRLFYAMTPEHRDRTAALATTSSGWARSPANWRDARRLRRRRSRRYGRGDARDRVADAHDAGLHDSGVDAAHVQLDPGGRVHEARRIGAEAVTELRAEARGAARR